MEELMSSVKEPNVSERILAVIRPVIPPAWRQPVELLAATLPKLTRILPLGPDHVEVLTYEDAMGYFITASPKAAVGGAMVLEPAGQDLRLCQVFLDLSDRLVLDDSGQPCGRQLLINQLDEELADAFAGSSMLIVR